jgi:hypothetical protein
MLIVVHHPSMPDSCPPVDSAPSAGTFYRLAERRHRKGDATDDDTWAKPHQKPGKNYGKTGVCEMHAISVFKDFDEIQQARGMSPWAGKKPLAEVVVDETMGRLQHRPSTLGESHYEWWTNPYNLTPRALVIDDPIVVRP